MSDILYNPPANPLYTNRTFGGPAVAEVPDYVAPVPEDTRGEFSKGFDRGVDTLQALFGGATALTGDLLGSDTLKDFGYNYYQAQMAEAAQSPAAVPTLSDINGVASFVDWFVGKAGELAPSVLESVAAAAVGTAAGGFAGGIIGATSGKTVLKSLLMGTVKRNMAKGMGPEIAAEKAFEEFAKTGAGQLLKSAMRKQAAKLGAQTAIVGSTTALEAGGNWVDDYETNGDGTNPVGDLFFGTLSGLSEMVGAEGLAINRFLGPSASRSLLRTAGKEATKEVDQGFLLTLSKEVAKNVLAEGGQEGFQESLSAINSYLVSHSIDALMTPEVFKQVLEASAAGAVGGVAFGAPTGVHSYFSAKAHANQVETQQKAAVDSKAYKYQLNVINTSNAIQDHANQIEQHKKAAAELMFGNTAVPNKDALYAEHLAAITNLTNNIDELEKTKKQQSAELEAFINNQNANIIPADSELSKQSNNLKDIAYNKIDALVKASVIDLSNKMADLKKLGAPERDLAQLRSGIQKIKATALKNVETIAKVPAYESYRVGPVTTEFVSGIQSLHASLSTAYTNKRNSYLGLSKEEVEAFNAAAREKEAFEQGLYDARRGKIEKEVTVDAEILRKHRAENQQLQQIRERIAQQQLGQRVSDMSAYLDKAYPTIIDQERIAREQRAANNQLEMKRGKIAAHPATNAGVSDQSAYLNNAQPVDWTEGYSRASTRVLAENSPWTQSMGNNIRRAGQETETLERARQISNAALLEQKRGFVHELLVRRAKVLKKKIPTWSVIKNMPARTVETHFQRALSGLYGKDIQGTAQMFADAAPIPVEPFVPNTKVTAAKEESIPGNKMDARRLSTDDATRNANARKDKKYYYVLEQQKNGDVVYDEYLTFDEAKSIYDNLIEDLRYRKNDPDIQEYKSELSGIYIMPHLTDEEVADGMSPFDVSAVRSISKSAIFNNEKLDFKVVDNKRNTHFTAQRAKTRAKVQRIIDKYEAVSDAEKHVIEVAKWISPLLEKFPAFFNQEVKIARDGNGIKIGNVIITAVTSSKSAGSFYTKSNAIVLHAQNINSADEAAEVLLHEGLVHFGLGTVFTSSAERTKFMKNVAKLYEGTSLRAAIEKAYADANLTEAGLGEEIVAHQAMWLMDRYPAKFPHTKPTLVQRFKALIRRILAKFNSKLATEQNINAVLEAAAKNLQNSEIKITSPITGYVADSSLEMRVLPEQWEHTTKTGLDSLKTSIKMAWDRATNVKDADNYLDADGYLNYTAMDKIKENLQDYFHPVQMMQRALKQLGGKDVKITTESNVFATEEAVANKMAEGIRRFKRGWVEPLEEALKAYAKISGVSSKQAQENIDRYLIASHAIKRNEVLRGRGNTDPAPSGMSDATARKILEGGEFKVGPELKAIRKAVSDVSSYQISMMRKYNLLPKAQIDAMVEAYGDNYVPLKGFVDMLEETDKRYRVRSKNAVLAIKRATGRTEGSIAQSPLVHSILQTMDIISAAHRAETGRALLKLIEDNKELSGTENFFVKRADQQPTKFKWEVTKTGNLEFKAQENPFANDPRAFTVIDNEGSRVRLLAADQRVADALTGANMAGTIPIIQWIGKLTRMVAKFATTLNPGFIVTNPIRDIVTAAINITDEKFDSSTYKLDKEPIRRKILNRTRLTGAANALYKYNTTRSMSTIDSEWRDYLRLFREHGGFSEPFDLNDFASLSKEITKNIESAYKRKDGVFAYGSRLYDNVTGWLENMSSSLENMTRLNTFRTLFDAWVAKGMDPNEAAIRAASAARNITVNFSKRGAWAPIMSPLFMFSNASIQGIRRMMKTIMRQPGEAAKVLGIASAGLLAMHSFNMFFGGDDEDGIPFYQKVPNWVRDNNFVLMVPYTGKYIKIPFPYGYNLISTFVNRLFNVTTGQESVGKAIPEIAYAAFDNFSPLGASGSNWTLLIPTVFRPPLQIALNKGYFGQKIMPDVPSWIKYDVPDSTRYWNTVNPVARFVAWGLNEMTGGSEIKPGMLDVSPESLEYMVESYTGGLGKFGMNTLKLLHDMTRATFDLGEVKTEDVLNHFPVARRFLGGVSFYSTLEMFNERKSEMQIKELELKLLRSQGKKEEAKQFLEDNPTFMRDKRVISGIEEKVKKLTKVENAIMKSSSITDSTAKLEKIRRQKEQLVKQAIKLMKD